VAIFDVYVKKLAEYVGEMRGKGRQVREIDCPTTIGKLLEGLPVRVGPQASSGLILRGDTFAELGNPATGSCAFLLWTDNPSLIRDGKITLIVDLGEKEHEALEQNQYVGDQIEGYMIRSVSQLLWSRVSKDAAEKGFCFETLGRALMAIFKSEVPKVQAVEIVFVTSVKEDLQPLDDISTQVREIAKNIVLENWEAKGINLLECTFGWDCNSCPDKPVCDNIRELVTVRKKRARKSETATKS